MPTGTAAPASTVVPPQQSATVVRTVTPPIDPFAALGSLPFAASTVPQPAAATPAPPEQPEQPPMDVTIAFTGDVLLHSQINAAARTSKGWNYAPLFSPASPWIRGADLAICQLEVPLAPPGHAPSSYPVFAAPRPVVAGLARDGWDGCATATNHSLDQGWAGIKTTVGALKSNGMGYVGMALSAKDANAAQFYQLTKDGQTITVAHLSTAYGFNGFSEPKGKPWAVAKNNVKQIAKRAKAARAAGADVVLLSVHFGTEYVTKPTASQKRFVAAIAKTGVIDAVIGGHPHVVEPITKVPGGVGGHGMWVAYSLGNFVSNMTQSLRTLGLIDYVHVTKDANGARVTGMTWAAVAVDLSGGKRVRVLEASAGKRLGTISAATATSFRHTVHAIVGNKATEQTKPPKPSGTKLTVLPHGSRRTPAANTT